jgi:uncharacterized protein involved in response to NO
MATIPLMEPVYKGSQGPVFFAAGFRPFFLFAAIQAGLMLPLWLAVFFGILPAPPSWNPLAWHAHAMVFGFAGAAVGGFLLTAVPSWTNTHPVSGRPLALLFTLWAAGRACVALAAYLPAWLVAVAELGYWPLLAFMVARPLIQAGKWRNIAFLPILALMALADLCTQLEPLTGSALGLKGVYLGLFLLLLMIVIVGGRIIPSFTQNWLRMQGRAVEMPAGGWLEPFGAVGSLVAAALAQLLAPTSPVAGGLALLAAVIHGYRLARWHGLETIKAPILVILHLGYGWLVVGLALLGLSAFIDALLPSAALHALTIGCVGTMIIAVMSRAALGHSGRPLLVAPATVGAYGLLSLAALARVAAPLLPGAFVGLTLAGGVAWTLAWLVYAIVYWPVCTRPRADGRPG